MKKAMVLVCRIWGMERREDRRTWKGSRFLMGLYGIVALLLLPAGGAEAFNPAHLEKLKDMKECKRCDLSGANLSGANLFRADLTGANLSGANLSGADLRDADLSRADLTGANLNMAYLRRAILRGANLSGAKLSGAKLDGANLDGATWTDGRKCAHGSIGVCK